MSAIVKEPGFMDRNETWMRNKWQPADFRPAASRCYGQEAVPRNHFIGVTVGAWVRYRGREWQVWSWHRQSGMVWLANGQIYTDAHVTACEVIGQCSDDTLPLEGFAS